jgi:drug/metabolite transporter superfamily protein YnfA
MRQRLRGIWFSLALLLVAAVLEVGGDAIVRFGLHASSFSAKASLLVLGAGILFAYGVFVNSAPADFGRLLGIYVVLFFLVAQIVNRLAFGVTPSAPILVGGAFIVIGGAVMTLWRASQS